jgi:octaprenyl-diphosphate synthase
MNLAETMNTLGAVDTLHAAATHGDAGEVDAHLLELRVLLGDELHGAERDMALALEGAATPLPEVGQHLLAAGGKRIRPMLVLLAAGASGADPVRARTLAVAGELVHLATLLHDDVVDDAPLRRGQPTPRVVWSNTASVLGGDYALTRALDLVADCGRPEPLREAIETLRLLVEGEVLQLRNRETASLRREDYYAIVERKTASLFRWCCRAGAFLGENPAAIEALGRFGHALGVCFQVIDDVLDVDADPDAFGKQSLIDLREGRVTLPLLIAAERDPELSEALLATRAWLDDGASRGELFAARAVDSMRRTGALEAARAIARSYATEAVESATLVPQSAYRDAMVAIAQALTARVG